MRLAVASSKWQRIAGSALALGGAAWLLGPLERSIGDRAPQRALASEQLSGLAERGGGLAVLGGLRSAVAGGFWVRTNLAWERREMAATAALIDVTVAADERPMYFWLNGARMIAFDMPEWQGPRGRVPEGIWLQNSHRQARAALAFLEKGLRWHGASPELYVEMANLHLRRLGDVEAAAHYYRLAAEQPQAPYYAARIYGELLGSLGRDAEALAWLRSIVNSLPADDPAARRDVVEARIRSLEVRLAVPPR